MLCRILADADRLQVQVLAIDKVQFAHVIARQLQSALQLKAWPVCATDKLIVRRLADRYSPLTTLLKLTSRFSTNPSRLYKSSAR
jgi:hypothetical protein